MPDIAITQPPAHLTVIDVDRVAGLQAITIGQQEPAAATMATSEEVASLRLHMRRQGWQRVAPALRIQLTDCHIRSPIPLGVWQSGLKQLALTPREDAGTASHSEVLLLDVPAHGIHAGAEGSCDLGVAAPIVLQQPQGDHKSTLGPVLLLDRETLPTPPANARVRSTSATTLH